MNEIPYFRWGIKNNNINLARYNIPYYISFFYEMDLT